MISEFTSNSEFKRVIEEQQIKSNRLKQFLKSKGIVLFNNKATDLALASYTLFLGSEDMTELQELMIVGNNYQKSTMLVLTPAEDAEEDESILDILLDEINRYKTVVQGKYIIENINKEDEDNLHITFTYEKKLPGRIKLINTKKKTVNVHLFSIAESRDIKVDIRQTDSNDSKEFISILEDLKDNISENNEQIFNIRHITLDKLKKDRKIQFFDLIAQEELDEWILETIPGITVKKLGIDDEEINVTDDEDATAETRKALIGITSAILKGNGLRENSFVNNCIEEGFGITAMKFKYRRKKDIVNEGAVSVIIEISFNNDDIRIDIDRSYIEEDGKEQLNPLTFKSQDQIVKLFQEISYNAYISLLNEQNSEEKILLKA